MSRGGERYLPFAGAVGAAVLAVVVDEQLEVEPFSRLVSAGTMALGLIVAGFTATQRNMLLGMSGSRVLRHAAHTGYYQDVLGHLSRCIYAGLFVTLLSVAGLFIDGCTWVWTVWLALWVGSLVLVVGLLILNELLMSSIFARYMREKAPRKE